MIIKPRGGDVRKVLSRGFILPIMSHRYIVLISVLLLWGCASMQPPGGGPEDKESPEVLWNIPTRDSVRVTGKVDILIAFSEKMNASSVENAIYISPYPSGETRFFWKKNILRIVLADSLERNKTFVVTVGTDAKDSHANPLAQAYSFAFSSGDSIDRGSIGGRVVAENTKGVSIWSYRLSGNVKDDSLIYRKRADYITQVGAGGKYRLSYLSAGTYRVYAIADLDADYLYSPAGDFIGLPFKDVTIGSGQTTVADVDFMMFQEDTSKFMLQTAVPVDKRMLVAGFSKPLPVQRYFESSEGFDDLIHHFNIRDSTDGAEIPITDLYLNPVKLNEVRILTEPKSIRRRYFLTVNGLRSQGGETISSGQISFDGGEDSSNIKTEAELISPRMTDGFVLPNDGFTFRLSNGVQRSLFEKKFLMYDSLNRQVDGKFLWANSSQVEFRPLKLLESRMAYRIKIGADSATDWHGKILSDTAWTYSFISFKTDSLGFVSGTVVDEDSAKSGVYYITCRNLNRNMRDHFVRLVKAGTFNLHYLVPGRYSVVAFKDEDANGLYSHGRVSPIVFSEKFTAYSDTLVVRPNWETSNILLRFKK